MTRFIVHPERFKYDKAMKRKITASDVLSLNSAERVELLQLLWESLPEPDGAFELTDAVKQELDRRWAGYKRNPSRAKSWEAVKAGLVRRV